MSQEEIWRDWSELIMNKNVGKLFFSFKLNLNVKVFFRFEVYVFVYKVKEVF